MKSYTTYGWIDRDKKIAQLNGILVDMEKPTTGVSSSNELPNWFYEFETIDLGYEEAVEAVEGEEIEDYDSTGPWLVGDWRKSEDGKYEPFDGKEGFSAIQRESVVQFVLSRTTKRGAPCSPCYPGQVDLDTDGEFLGYTLTEED